MPQEGGWHDDLGALTITMDEPATDINAISQGATKARRALTRRLIDVVGMPETLVSVQERRVAADLLFDLLREGDADMRRRAAARFTHLHQGPKNVLRMLARDDIDIARPILEDCKSLDALDMLKIISMSDQEHRLLIARRSDVSEVVSEALAERAEPLVLEALLRNVEAKLSETAIDRMVDISKEQPQLKQPLLRRQELRPANAFLMFWWADHDERIQIIRRFAVQRSILLDTAADLFRAAAEERWSDPLVMRTLQLIERRQRDRKAIEQAGHESLEQAIAEAAMNLTPEVITKLSALSGVRPVTGKMIFDDHGAEALAIFCKATGLKRPYFEMLWQAHRGATAPERSGEYEAGVFAFDILSPPKAQTILRYWDWAIGGASTLDTNAFAGAAGLVDDAELASGFPRKKLQVA